MRRQLLVFLMLLMFAGAAAREAGGAGGAGGGLGGLGGGLGGFEIPTSSEPVTAKAFASVEAVPPGGEGRIAVELKINSRYHIQSAFAKPPYIPASVTPAPAAGVSFGEIQYQKDHEIPTPPALGSGTLAVYEGTVYVIVPFKVAPDAAAGVRTIDLALRTQACDDKVCLPPKTVVLKVPVTVGAAGSAPVAANADVFAAADKQTFLAGPAAETDAAPPRVASAAPAATGPGKAVELYNNAKQVALIAERPYEPGNSDENTHTLPAIFLFALLGGLILNIMPCVLPVIPLKALSFVQQAHGNPRVAMLHALTFSAGVVSLFVALAVVLRTFGLFYGQQFQSPAFLIAMTLFVVALSLSMLGVWTINPPQAVYQLDAKFSQAGMADLQYAGPQTPKAHGGNPLLGSFGSGIMATLLATPCSAPFLGPVFAWALVQPAWLTAVMLAIVGIGMSLPYILLAAFPKLLNKIPSAGRWSELLKQGLGIVMLGVAVYLVTLVPDTQLWPWVMVACVVVGLICWGWGQIPSPLMPRGQIWAIRAVVLAVGVVLSLGVYALAARVTTTRTMVDPSGTAFLPDRSNGEWLPFNIALLDEALKQNRPVVVDWTADWCINCRVLEATVLDSETVRNAFNAKNALLLKADLSEDNPPATALNKKLGGEAIPVLAIFKPSAPHKPVVLRDSYSTTRVVRELGK